MDGYQFSCILEASRLALEGDQKRVTPLHLTCALYSSTADTGPKLYGTDETLAGGGVALWSNQLDILPLALMLVWDRGKIHS